MPDLCRRSETIISFHFQELSRRLRVPGGPGIRDDSGIYEGFEVPIHYDSLLSKLVAWGRNRKEAIERMTRALEEYLVVGIKTTIPFYQQVLRTAAFEKGNVTTSFIDDFFKKEKLQNKIHMKTSRWLQLRFRNLSV